ncbi:MAG: enoyl-CoA hydratase-related protein [Acidimicrobiales bacterium]
MDLKATRYEVAEGIATITLSRPERHNAWTGRMHTEYRWSLNEAENDHTVRAIVVTGDPAGRAFCVGGDSDALLKHSERGEYDPGTPESLARPGYGVRPEFDAPFAHQFGMATPIIAAVNGAAAGVGLAVLCFADLRFVAEDATLTTAHGRLGLAAEYGLAWLLPRLIGLTRANDLLLSSRKFNGVEALDLGLANAALPAGTVLAHAQEYASELVSNNSAASLRETKRLIYTDLHRSAAEAIEDSESLLTALMANPDYREGVAALRERRPPRFAGPK